jgi:hypothetical protein
MSENRTSLMILLLSPLLSPLHRSLLCDNIKIEDGYLREHIFAEDYELLVLGFVCVILNFVIAGILGCVQQEKQPYLGLYSLLLATFMCM